MKRLSRMWGLSQNQYGCILQDIISKGPKINDEWRSKDRNQSISEPLFAKNSKPINKSPALIHPHLLKSYNSWLKTYNLVQVLKKTIWILCLNPNVKDLIILGYFLKFTCESFLLYDTSHFSKYWSHKAVHDHFYLQANMHEFLSKTFSNTYIYDSQILYTILSLLYPSFTLMVWMFFFSMVIREHTSSEPNRIQE